jgi:hypothetical protein
MRRGSATGDRAPVYGVPWAVPGALLVCLLVLFYSALDLPTPIRAALIVALCGALGYLGVAPAVWWLRERRRG